MSTDQLSTHLQWREVLRGSGCSTVAALPSGIELALRDTAVRMFEPLRERFGGPLIVIAGGGYRSPATNKAVGGAKASTHMQGFALDIVPASRMPADHLRLADLANWMQREGYIPPGGIGRYFTADGAPRFTHVDVRGFLVRWSSGRVDRLEVA